MWAVTDMALGDWFREKRKLSRLTQEQLAKMIGYTSGWISHIENDMAKNPSQELLLKSAQAFRSAGLDITDEEILKAAGLIAIKVDDIKPLDEDSLVNSLQSLGRVIVSNKNEIKGRVPCSDPEHRLQEDIGPILAYYRADYALIAQGDSMEPHIHDGDMLYVRRTEQPEIGKIMIALVYGDSVAKKLTGIKVDQDTGDIIYTLSPTNHKYQEIRAHDVQFQGVVVGKGMSL